ncbi:alpha/beta hydrolase [Aureimonas sp. OT7]|uniref:alpha/beta hydrolase n=1 Tax=Aureimonas sp. OT7 TaxID=2816454 RepID=UPI0017800C5D|nr:alpha/beta hydrolase [Aureimonas sp. OT7]QOG05760.1 alpha/beta hydrolase [Aureimonas sp. OT7]
MTQTGPDSFIHRYSPGQDEARRPLLLLHGTGGNEEDLIDLGQTVSPGSALLSPRGKVNENGMPRFFRRLAEGVFDEEDVKFRANELADFVAESRLAYGLDTPIAFGFSNGANIASALLLLRPEALAGAVLLRAMVPLQKMPSPDLSSKRILMLSGAMDPIVPAANAAMLAEHLKACGADVTYRNLPASHGLTQADLRHSAEFLAL